ncbi:MAG TPA: hypothetical protein VMG13_05700, partial [Trebonia sp.]|nr:hypothetical protein [Trebonia sp.]
MGISRARADSGRVTKRGAAPAAIVRQRREGNQPATMAERLAELTEREAVTRALIAKSPFAILAMDADSRL